MTRDEILRILNETFDKVRRKRLSMTADPVAKPEKKRKEEVRVVAGEDQTKVPAPLMKKDRRGRIQL